MLIVGFGPLLLPILKGKMLEKVMVNKLNK